MQSIAEKSLPELEATTLIGPVAALASLRTFCMKGPQFLVSRWITDGDMSPPKPIPDISTCSKCEF